MNSPACGKPPLPQKGRPLRGPLERHDKRSANPNHPGAAPAGLYHQRSDSKGGNIAYKKSCVYIYRYMIYK